MLRSSLLLLAVFLFDVLPLAAHDLYLIPQKFQVKSGESILISAHVGDAFPSGDSSLDPRRIVEARVMGGANLRDWQILGRASHGFATFSQPGSNIVTVSTAPKFLELEAPKFESYLKEEGLDAIIAWRKQNGEAMKPGRELYSKFAKSLVITDQSGKGFDAKAGFPIEFVLEQDPSRLAPGAELSAIVYWKGKPASGLQVEVASTPDRRTPGKPATVGSTDANGRIRVKLDKAGLYRLHTLAMERHENPAEADWKSVWATFTFEVSPAAMSNR
jgi:hypothetical protein